MTPEDGAGEMRYVVWKAGPVLSLMSGLAALATEFGAHGYAYRELGLDSGGRVIHRKPSPDHRHGEFGLLDSPPIDIDIAIGSGDVEEIGADLFEEMWLRPNQAPPPKTGQPGLLRRLFGKE